MKLMTLIHVMTLSTASGCFTFKKLSVAQRQERPKPQSAHFNTREDYTNLVASTLHWTLNIVSMSPGEKAVCPGWWRR